MDRGIYRAYQCGTSWAESRRLAEKFCIFLLIATVLPAFSSPVPSVIIEAESAEVRGPIFRTDRGIAYTNTTASTSGALAVYTFTIPETGAYAIRSIVRGLAAATNELHVSMDREGAAPGGTWRFVSRPDYGTNWVRCANTMRLQTPFNLKQGQHTLLVRCTSGSVMIDRFELFKLPSPPGGPKAAGLAKVKSGQLD